MRLQRPIRLSPVALSPVAIRAARGTAAGTLVTVRRNLASDPVALSGGVLAFALGLLGLVIWAFAIEPPPSVAPGLLTMTVHVGIALCLLGLSIGLRTRPERTVRRLGVLAGVVAFALAALAGIQYVAAVDLGIDQWVFREAHARVGTQQPPRMSPTTVLSVLSISVAILLSGRLRGGRAVAALGLGSALLGLMNVLDFFLDPEPTLLAGFTQMSLGTAVAVMALGVGVVGLLPGRGPLHVVSGNEPTARLARRLLIASVAAPVGLAWLHIKAEQTGFPGANFGTTLTVLGTFVFLALVIGYSARSARRLELDRSAALEERDRFFSVSKDLLATASAGGYFLRLNPAWTSVLGYDLDTLLSRPFSDFIHPDDLAATAAEVERQVQAGEPVFNFQNRYRHRDGSYRWLEWTSAASDDGLRLYAAARDITARKLEEERFRAPALANERRLAAARDRVLTIIESEGFAPHYQPIIDMERGTIVGFEGLTRFRDGWSPAEAFGVAAECGVGRALELATLAAAVRDARDLPRGAWLSVNISPSVLADVDATRVALGFRSRPLVLEITEHETIAAYGPVRDAVRALGPDVRLAVDDAGAGVANFNHLVELRPNFVKVDSGLVRGVDFDLSRQAFVAGILHFAAAAGCDVIAEGIETQAERDTLVRLGVRLGQGYLLGRAAPAPDWHATAVAAPRIRRSVQGIRAARRAAG